MNRKKSFVALCVLAVSLLVTGCRLNATDTNQREVNHDDDIVVETAYGNLYFPSQWEDYLQIDEVNAENTIEVKFSAKDIDNTIIPLFSIIVGGESGNVAGTLTAEDGTQHNVYVEIEEIRNDDSLTQTELNRFYAMQEDLNYLIDNLE